MPSYRPHDVVSGQPLARLEGQALTTLAIDSRQQPESLSADELIRHEAHAPYLVGVLDQYPKVKVRFGPDRPSLRRSRRPTARSSALKTLREHHSPGYTFLVRLTSLCKDVHMLVFPAFDNGT